MILKKKVSKNIKTTKEQKVSSGKKPNKIGRFFIAIGKFFCKIFCPIGRYFKGSWQELKQVRWPDRKATWSLTGAVLLFTAIFVVIIVLLDAGFEMLFNLIVR